MLGQCMCPATGICKRVRSQDQQTMSSQGARETWAGPKEQNCS